MLVTNKVAFKDGADLGMVIAVCNADGFEMARMYGIGALRDREPDLTTQYVDGEVVSVKWHTPDGHAFCDLVAEHVEAKCLANRTRVRGYSRADLR